MQQTFQISATLLVCLASLILAGAEESPLPALTIPLAVGTWWFVDRLRIQLFPAWVATGLALLAFVAAGLEYQLFEQQSLLGVGGHLLTYLTWSFLLRPKDSREYWWLFALSVLQVAVSALLTFSIWFGLGLLIFNLLAIWTLSVFLLYRSTRSTDPDILTGAQLVLAGPAGQPASGSSIGQVWNGVAPGPQVRLLTRRFFGNTVFVFGLSLLIGSLFFLFIPRVWANSSLLERLGSAGRALTGFSNEVRLGDMGEILEDKNEVLTVRAFHVDADNIVDNDRQFTMAELVQFFGHEPLFRGGVLETYEDGRWRHHPPSNRDIRTTMGIDEASIRVHFDLQPIGSQTVFSYGNVIGARATIRSFSLRWNLFSNELQRGQETDLGAGFAYDIYTNNQPPDAWTYVWRQRMLQRWRDEAAEFPRRAASPLEQFDGYLRELTAIPKSLEPLFPVTARVVGSASNPLETAQKIETWFTASGEFDYTTKLSVDDASIDPILDFVTNRRKGHCEYFASAMAMMLRTQQIPSRVINGFKGGVFSVQTNSIRVQQLHAHAWVEAYIDGHWLTFDPTPGMRDETVQKIERAPSRVSELWIDAQQSWSKLSQLSQDAQQTRIYRPLLRLSRAILNVFGELLKGNASFLQSIAETVRNPSRWFSVEGGALAGAAMLLLSGGIWLGRRLWRLIQHWNALAAAQRALHHGPHRTVPFYERFTSILREHGIIQRPTQTAREFVDDSLLMIQPRLAAAGIAGWPMELVEKFYRVRFGGDHLSEADVTQLDLRLNELESSLKTADAEAR
ncbi:transglutaminase TgpA family protein [Planctomicrobium piriforme]|uniref:Transglutaminase-like domain-containing protein n=1 Tax=Planctomicrobium piriforme TaxID=1576369 RepID=A0A1I3HH05_9PLAN|nr:DUF3488 and transglutaminase-like domain-containing protein [Planctomicrobium piriforme]SFI34857.1 protein of unknown function [Planctomicrobium piriforme]